MLYIGTYYIIVQRRGSQSGHFCAAYRLQNSIAEIHLKLALRAHVTAVISDF